METQFEVSSILEEKHYVEFYRYIWRKNYWMVLVVLVLCILSACLESDKDPIVWVVYIILMSVYVGVYALWMYSRPRRAARKTMKQNQTFDGSERAPSVTTFGEDIRDESPNATAKIPYDRIKSIHISENVIVLIDIRDVAIIMDKNGFNKGSFQDFLPFIREKCPQLKLPEW